jgi:hypothetical protein
MEQQVPAIPRMPRWNELEGQNRHSSSSLLSWAASWSVRKIEN